MTLRFTAWASTLLTLALAAGPAGADQVHRRDGRILEGQLDPGWENPQVDVRLRIGATRITIPRSQVEQIIVGGPGENLLLTTRDAFSAGHIAEGLLALQEALGAGAPTDSVAALLMTWTVQLEQAAEHLPPPARAALGAALTASAQSSLPRQQELAACRLQLKLALGDFEDIEHQLELLGTEYLSTRPALARRLTQRIEQRIERQLAAGDDAGALASLDQLQQIDPIFAKARRIQYDLEWARRLRDGQRHDEALAVYIDRMLPVEPVIALDRIRQTLQEAEIELRRRSDLTGAISLYERFGMTQLPEETRPRLVQLWRDLGGREMMAREYEAARAAYEQAQQVVPGSADKDLLRLEYLARNGAIEEQDPMGHYELGVWCRSHQLDEEALRQFQHALEHPVVGANAAAYIGQIKVEQANRDIEAILKQYQRGEYVEAAGALHEFIEGNPGPGFMAQAHELQRLVSESLALRKDDSNHQAEGLLERAQRAYYDGRYEEADQLLELLLSRYRDSIAHQRALEFHQLVRDRLALARLERGERPDGATLSEDAPGTGTPPTAIELQRIIRDLDRTDHDEQE